MPAKFSELKRAFEKRGITVEKPTNGSHWKCRAPNGRMYPLTAHNGLKSEITDVYIKGACRNLGISYEELLAELRGEKTMTVAEVIAATKSTDAPDPESAEARDKSN